MPPRFNVNPSNRKIYGKTDSSTPGPSSKLSSKPLETFAKKPFPQQPKPKHSFSAVFVSNIH